MRVAARLRRSALELTLLLLLKLASLPKQSRTRLQDQVCSDVLRGHSAAAESTVVGCENVQRCAACTAASTLGHMRARAVHLAPRERSRCVRFPRRAAPLSGLGVRAMSRRVHRGLDAGPHACWRGTAGSARTPFVHLPKWGLG